MERLTIAERALLANVRQMEHYRRGFYLNVVTGAAIRAKARTAAAASSAAAVWKDSAASAAAASASVGGFGGGGSAARASASPAAPAPSRRAATSACCKPPRSSATNTRTSPASATASSSFKPPTTPAASTASKSTWPGRRSTTRRASCSTRKPIYEIALDNFKLQHGLPPGPDDQDRRSAAGPFQPARSRSGRAADPRDRRAHRAAREASRASRRRGSRGRTARAAGDAAAGQPKRNRRDGLRDAGRAKRRANSDCVASSGSRRRKNDFAELEEALPERRASLERLAEREEAREVELDPDLFSVEQLDERVAAARAGTRRRSASGWQACGRDWTRSPATPTLPPDQHRDAADQRAHASSPASCWSCRCCRPARGSTRSRSSRSTSRRKKAICIASRYRRDWMNARAALVDSWRLIHFNANDLESDLDLVFSGDIGNVGDNPFRLRGTNGRLRVGLEFDAPLTRLAERNVYRQSLIEYQQARRDYYQFRDGVQRDVRSTLRQLRLDELELRAAPRGRARGHHASRPGPAAALGAGPARRRRRSRHSRRSPAAQSQFGDTVARDLVNALIDLLNVQNDFLSVWVDHEVQRLQLDFDLGIMELDAAAFVSSTRSRCTSFLDDLPNTAPFELPDAVRRGRLPSDAGRRRTIGRPIELLPSRWSILPEAAPTRRRRCRHAAAAAASRRAIAGSPADCRDAGLSRHAGPHATRIAASCMRLRLAADIEPPNRV